MRINYIHKVKIYNTVYKYCSFIYQKCPWYIKRTLNNKLKDHYPMLSIFWRTIKSHLAFRLLPRVFVEDGTGLEWGTVQMERHCHICMARVFNSMQAQGV